MQNQGGVQSAKAEVVWVISDSAGARPRMQLIRTRYTDYPIYENGGSPCGDQYKLRANEHEYTYDYASWVQIAERKGAALVFREVSSNDRATGWVTTCSYYQPYDSLCWEKTGYCSEGILPSSQYYLSPSGYVVAFSRYTGELSFIDEKGQTYASSTLYSIGEKDFDNLGSAVVATEMTQRNGHHPQFSDDGKIFAFVLGGYTMPGLQPGTNLFIFSDKGHLRCVKNFPANTPFQFAVSPQGDRICIGIYHVGDLAALKLATGSASAKTYLVSADGEIIREVEGIAREIRFSASGHYLMFNSDITHTLDAQSGQDTDRFEADR